MRAWGDVQKPSLQLTILPPISIYQIVEADAASGNGGGADRGDAGIGDA